MRKMHIQEVERKRQETMKEEEERLAAEAKQREQERVQKEKEKEIERLEKLKQKEQERLKEKERQAEKEKTRPQSPLTKVEPGKSILWGYFDNLKKQNKLQNIAEPTECSEPSELSEPVEPTNITEPAIPSILTSAKPTPIVATERVILATTSNPSTPLSPPLICVSSSSPSTPASTPSSSLPSTPRASLSTLSVPSSRTPVGPISSRLQVNFLSFFPLPSSLSPPSKFILIFILAARDQFLPQIPRVFADFPWTKPHAKHRLPCPTARGEQPEVQHHKHSQHSFR